MKKFILLLFTLSALANSSLFAQEKIEDPTEDKEVVIKRVFDKHGNLSVEKVIKGGDDVDVLLKEMGIDLEVELENINGETSKKYKLIKRNENGTEEIIEWDGTGDMPEELKEHLDNDLFHIQHIGDHKDLYDIDVKSEIIDGEEHYKIIVKSDGEEKVFEWNGNGELPEDIEENVFILKDDHEMYFGHDNLNISVDHDENDGHHKIRIVIDKEGEEPEVIEWEGDGEIPDDIKEKLEENNVRMFHGQGAFELDSKGVFEPLNKAFLGVHIEDHEQGAKVIKVEEASSASAAGIMEGDIITSVDDQKIEGLESLIGVLKDYEPGDEVRLGYIRDGQKSQVKSVLKERPANDRKIWIHDKEEWEDGENAIFFDDDHNVTKRKVIIIRKNKDDKEDNEPAKELKEEPVNFPEIRGKKLDLRGFSAYPNPTDDVINVSFVGEKSPIIVQVYDISGKEVYRKEVQDFDGYFNEGIDLGEFTQGQYILYVIQAGGFFSHQLVLN